MANQTAVFILRGLLITASVSTVLSADGLRAGRAAVKISPRAGTPMAGYYNTRLSTGVHDDLHAKAIVIEKDGRKAALVACDLIALGAEVITEARLIAARETGIPAANIMVSATHSHTGPLITGRSTREAAYGGDLDITKQYMKDLPHKIAEAVRLANAELAPAVASVGFGSEPSIAFNRRFFMTDNTVGWNPGKKNPKIIKPAGPIDPTVAVVYFASQAGKPLATYVNYTMHLDTVGGTDVSADYPFALSTLLGKIKGTDMLTLFTIGTAGNINHIDVSSATAQKGHGEAERLATVLAGEVLKTYTRLQPVDGSLKVASKTVQLAPAPVEDSDVSQAKSIADQVNSPKPPPFLDTVKAFKTLDVAGRAGKPYEAEVQVIALGGDLAWVALPGEVFVELGLAIKKQSPYRHTIVTELANGPSTYIPNEAAYAQGNYEPVSARVAAGSGEKLVEAAVQLLKETHAGTN